MFKSNNFEIVKKCQKFFNFTLQVSSGQIVVKFEAKYHCLLALSFGCSLVSIVFSVLCEQGERC